MENKIAIPSGVPIEISEEAVDLPGGLKGYPTKVVLSTGNIAYNKSQMGGWFVIDLDSVVFHKNSIIGDYNHNEDEVIGHADQWEVTDEGLVLQAYIIPYKDGDRASEILLRRRSGTPYEASPTVATEEATIEQLAEGETAIVRGREVTGPLRIYRNLPIRGYSVCPYATDKFTDLTILKAEEPMSEEIKPDDQSQETGEGGSQYTANPELEKFIELFGLESGVEFHRKGLSLEDAKDAYISVMRDENEKLKASPKKLNADEEQKPAENGGSEDTPAEPEKEDENAKLKAETAKLKADMTKLSAEVSKLKTGRGETEPLSTSTEQEPKPKEKTVVGDPVLHYANSLSKKK